MSNWTSSWQLFSEMWNILVITSRAKGFFQIFGMCFTWLFVRPVRRGNSEMSYSSVTTHAQRSYKSQQKGVPMYLTRPLPVALLRVYWYRETYFLSAMQGLCRPLPWGRAFLVLYLFLVLLLLLVKTSEISAPCFLFSFFFSLRLLKFQPLPNHHQLAGVLSNVLDVLCNILMAQHPVSCMPASKHGLNMQYRVNCLHIRGADKTFACKSQECLWQDWYISIPNSGEHW